MALEASRCLHTPTALANASPPPPATPPSTCRRPCRASPALESSHVSPALARPRSLRRPRVWLPGPTLLSVGVRPLPTHPRAVRVNPLHFPETDTCKRPRSARGFYAPAYSTSSTRASPSLGPPPAVHPAASMPRTRALSPRSVKFRPLFSHPHRVAALSVTARRRTHPPTRRRRARSSPLESCMLPAPASCLADHLLRPRPRARAHHHDAAARESQRSPRARALPVPPFAPPAFSIAAQRGSFKTTGPPAARAILPPSQSPCTASPATRAQVSLMSPFADVPHASPREQRLLPILKAPRCPVVPVDGPYNSALLALPGRSPLAHRTRRSRMYAWRVPALRTVAHAHVPGAYAYPRASPSRSTPRCSRSRSHARYPPCPSLRCPARPLAAHSQARSSPPSHFSTSCPRRLPRSRRRSLTCCPRQYGYPRASDWRRLNDAVLAVLPACALRTPPTAPPRAARTDSSASPRPRCARGSRSAATPSPRPPPSAPLDVARDLLHPSRTCVPVLRPRPRATPPPPPWTSVATQLAATLHDSRA
ncbi:hypothetical protein B0H15DRAFT_1001587 [Mycena belliarum]|uniref:Uncharacterized protein n=1 Tax=Mycena belliarum TaxID=1033014 RepID=A0AAD6XP89_9AGAR|nr:hypothetical protein B0H15DRAFT_1001587 [Mycena belliae]